MKEATGDEFVESALLEKDFVLAEFVGTNADDEDREDYFLTGAEVFGESG